MKPLVFHFHYMTTDELWAGNCNQSNRRNDSIACCCCSYNLITHNFKLHNSGCWRSISDCETMLTENEKEVHLFTACRGKDLYRCTVNGMHSSMVSAIVASSLFQMLKPHSCVVRDAGGKLIKIIKGNYALWCYNL